MRSHKLQCLKILRCRRMSTCKLGLQNSLRQTRRICSWHWKNNNNSWDVRNCKATIQQFAVFVLSYNVLNRIVTKWIQGTDDSVLISKYEYLRFRLTNITIATIKAIKTSPTRTLIPTIAPIDNTSTKKMQILLCYKYRMLSLPLAIVCVKVPRARHVTFTGIFKLYL